MKSLFTILLIVVSLETSAQRNISKEAMPLFVVDSVPLNTPRLRQAFDYVDPANIKNINVVKNAQHPNGVLYITLKDSTLISKLINGKFLSLSDIAHQHMMTLKHGQRPIYILNDKLVTDTSEVLIPAQFVRQVELVKADDAPYIKKAFPKAIIIKISTKEPILHIRGIAE